MRLSISPTLLALLAGAAVAAGDALLEHVAGARRNVLLPCMRNYTLAVTPGLAAHAPPCGWDDYGRFIASAGLDWADGAGGAAVRASVGADGTASVHLSVAAAELTSSLTTALTIVEALRLSLGGEAYAARTAAVRVDVVGWAFHWVEREVEEGTSNTVTVTPWDESTAALTALFWGDQIGGALRRLLPLVESVSVRGVGPEAPALPPTPLRADGWLTLELVSGVYSPEIAPGGAVADLTLLENSGLHDDLWPSGGGCVSDKGLFASLSGEELASRVGSGKLAGVGLGCLWRSSVEAMVASGRTFWATSYQSHEHLLAILNLESVGARVSHAFPNGFAEVIHTELDLLAPRGLLGESLRDAYDRKWSRAEALFAYTSAIWRHRIQQGGFEGVVRASRNRHVLAFRGRAPAPPASSLAHEAYAEAWRGANAVSAVQGRLRESACAAASLVGTPPRHQAILRAAWWCGGEERWPEIEPPPVPQLPVRSGEVQALCDQAREEAERGDAEASASFYRQALSLSPTDAVAWMSLGVQLSILDNADDETLTAFETAVTVADPRDPRPPLNLARYLAKISRPKEALSMFYAAAAADVEYFEEAKAGAGTARAQQGRFREALEDFQAASRLAPDDERLAAAVEATAAAADALDAVLERGVEDAVPDVCGTSCRDVVDASGAGVCAVTWAQGCGEATPPEGFAPSSTVAHMCGRACAFFNMQAGGRVGA